jgi:hypothetical protein
MAPIREGIHIVMARLNFDENGQPKDDAMNGRVDTMLTQLVWWAKALHAARGGGTRDVGIRDVGKGRTPKPVILSRSEGSPGRDDVSGSGE